MNRFALCLLFTLSAGIVSAQPGQPSADVTEKNIKILQDTFKNEKPSDVQLHGASEAIRQLTELGTDVAVPELQKLLAVEQLNTVVRTALINTPNKEKGIAALRESLTTLQGKNLAGVIESLGSVRDEKSVDALIKLAENADETIAKPAILALGKIATPKAVDAVLKILANTQSKYRADAASAALFATERLLTAGKTDVALTIFVLLRDHKEFPAIQATALRTSILLTESQQPVIQQPRRLFRNQRPHPYGTDNGLTLFVSLLKSNDDTQWKTVLDLANQLKSPQTGKLILNNMGSLPNEKKAVLLEVLGSRKDVSVVPALLQFAQGNEPLTKIAAIKALGSVGDLRGTDVILVAVGSSDERLAAAGKSSLMQLQGAEFNATIVKILDSQDKVLRLAALNVVGERNITEGVEKVKQLFNDSNAEIRIAAYKAFSQAIVANASDLELLLNQFETAVKENRSEAEQMELQTALKRVCLKIPVRDESVAVIEKLSETGDVKSKIFLLELLFLVGGEKAGQLVTQSAKAAEDEVVNKATELLGKWTTPDVAPGLIDLAENHPVEKYRIRTLNGYIRIIRQMGQIALEEKAKMIEKAEKLATRDEAKKLLAEIKERIEKLSKGTPIFDGKTFTGWEFRDNEKSFRIEDGAIVGGSMKQKNPKNQFITTAKEYGDFTLRLEAKMIGNDANGGVQFRSQRQPLDSKNPYEMVGYQADMTNTENFWGSLYDESRRAKFLAEADKELVKSIFRPNDWNELEIVCKENNVKIFLNGKQTIDYTEQDGNISPKGVIGLQIHSGPESEAWYRNIRIEE